MHPRNRQNAMGILQYHRLLYNYTHAPPHTHQRHRNIHRLIYLVTSLRAVCTTYSDPDEPRISNTIPVRCITTFQRSLHAQPHAHNTPAPKGAVLRLQQHAHLSAKYTTRHNIHQITRSAPLTNHHLHSSPAQIHKWKK
jgi:hypothetical protein